MPKKRIVRKGVLSVHRNQRFGKYSVSWRYNRTFEIYLIALQKDGRTINSANASTKKEAKRLITKFKRSVKGWKRSIY